MKERQQAILRIVGKYSYWKKSVFQLCLHNDKTFELHLRWFPVQKKSWFEIDLDTSLQQENVLICTRHRLLFGRLDSNRRCTQQCSQFRQYSWKWKEMWPTINDCCTSWYSSRINNFFWWRLLFERTDDLGKRMTDRLSFEMIYLRHFLVDAESAVWSENFV